MTGFSFRDNWLGLIVHQTTGREMRRHPHCWGCRFNPRTRKGATKKLNIGIKGQKVSIHAPARVRPDRYLPRPRQPRFQSTHPQGCDPPTAGPPRHPWCFNPRTRKGATLKPCPFCGGAGLFQSTHPQGCDASGPRARDRASAFQSTHPQGCDQPRPRGSNLAPVSIHAPARVRLAAEAAEELAKKFQSTHPQGCDRVNPLTPIDPGVSIHAPARVRRPGP